MIDNIDLSKWIFAGIVVYVIAIILIICIRMFIIRKVVCPYCSCGINCYNCSLEGCKKYCTTCKMVSFNGLSCCKRRHIVNGWFGCRRLPKCTCKCFLPRCYCLCCEFIFENEDLTRNPVVIDEA